MQTIQVPLKSILKYLTSIFLATEFASFVAGKITQIIEAMHYWLRGDMDKKGAKKWQK